VTFTPTSNQQDAIEAGPGPTIVLAGPGAGKTFCLIRRIHHLITRFGIPPDRILAVTFTNKAAEEIADRLVRDLGPEGQAVHRSTFHALCLRILRRHAPAAGLPAGFGVADEAYQSTLLRRLGVREPAVRDILGRFGRSRLGLVALPDDLEELFQRYHHALRHRELVDFDDLILLTHNLFETRPDIREEVAGQWGAILVDEFQDLSRTQYAIIGQLAGEHRQLFAVGDDEQSIFGWTGADPGILDAFCRDYGVEPKLLETNHRNSVEVFEAARRILKANLGRSTRRLVAARAGGVPVRALCFPTSDDELRWLLDDLIRDHQAAGLRWGDVGVLYRTHRIGDRIETELLRSGIPVRTALGRGLTDDPLIAPMLSAFRLLQSPDDPVPIEQMARQIMDPMGRELLRARYGDRPIREALRLFGRDRDMPELDRRRVRRLGHHVANLPALARSSRSFGELVEMMVTHRPSDRRTRLEERASELTDPAELPAARELADRLARVRASQGRIHLVVAGGLEVAIAGMVGAAGFEDLVVTEGPGPGPEDLVLDLPRTPGAAYRVFKALQLLAAGEGGLRLDRFVAFDIETTGLDTGTCGIIQVGAVRVVDGAIVDRFEALVDPGQPIPPEASRIHGLTDADVAGLPRFGEVWPGLRAFIGDEILVAHNGRTFDIPVLERHVAAAEGRPRRLPVLDTLPLARVMLNGVEARLEALAARFGIPSGRFHHALDDAITLVHVVHGLARLHQAYHRRTAFAAGLEWLGLGLVLEQGERTAEEQLLLEIGRMYTLGRYGDCLSRYGTLTTGRVDAPSLEEVIDRLGGRTLMRRIRERRTAAARYPSSVERLRRLVGDLEALPVGEGIARILDMAALARQEGEEVSHSQVSLLTLHSTKGLEFSRVYLMGVEDPLFLWSRDGSDPSEVDQAEARRLLYVGMTRAMDRLVLTRAVIRNGRPTGDGRLLAEIGVAEEQMQ
jgi:DNA polymerase III epsilon subunit family exonuclease